MRNDQQLQVLIPPFTSTTKPKKGTFNFWNHRTCLPSHTSSWAPTAHRCLVKKAVPWSASASSLTGHPNKADISFLDIKENKQNAAQSCKILFNNIKLLEHPYWWDQKPLAPPLLSWYLLGPAFHFSGFPSTQWTVVQPRLSLKPILSWILWD